MGELIDHVKKFELQFFVTERKQSEAALIQMVQEAFASKNDRNGYTTNIIEGLNHQVRRITRNKSSYW